MDIVTIHALKKYFGRGPGQVKALDGVELSIEKGRFTAIVGASGSGKTTFLRLKTVSSSSVSRARSIPSTVTLPSVG